MAYIPGDSNNNLLNGGLEADYIEAFGGFDTLFGGAGNDTLNGGEGHDHTREFGADSYTLTNTRLTANKAGVIESDTLISIENVGLDGNANDNFINALAFSGSTQLGGNAGNDTIIGGSGNDLVSGGSGRDSLTGNEGSDKMFGGSGDDIIKGVRSVAATPGRGEKDELTGDGPNTTAGRDTFVLGDANKIYYDDGVIGNGLGDYALIRDFQVGLDTIQLKGGVEYRFEGISGPNGLVGLGITAQLNGSSEFLGILQSNSPADLQRQLQIVNAPAGEITTIR